MSNGLLTLFDPDLYEAGTFADLGVVPSVFPAGVGGVRVAPPPLTGKSTQSVRVFLNDNPTGGGLGVCFIGVGLDSITDECTVGFFEGYPAAPGPLTNGIVVRLRTKSVVCNGVNVLMTPVAGTPPIPAAGHVEVRLEYIQTSPSLVSVSAQVYYDGVLKYQVSAEDVSFPSGEVATLRAGMATGVEQYQSKHIVFYDTAILTEPLGITKVRNLLTNASDLNPPADDGSFVTVLPAGINLTLANTDLGNVLAGALVLRATPNTPGEVAELVATVTSQDLLKQEGFTTGTLPLFSVGSYYFPLTDFSASELYGGRLNLKSLEPES